MFDVISVDVNQSPLETFLERMSAGEPCLLLRVGEEGKDRLHQLKVRVRKITASQGGKANLVITFSTHGFELPQGLRHGTYTVNFGPLLAADIPQEMLAEGD